jgi:hypothetical protein
MAMERVTVEQNGERFTLEVPEGTSDADIQSFLSQQQTSKVTPENASADKLVSSVGSAIGSIPGASTVGEALSAPFIAGQNAAPVGPEKEALQNIAAQNLATGAVKSVPAVANFAERLPGNIVNEAKSLWKVANKIGPDGAKILGNQFLETPIRTAADTAKAWAMGHATLGNMLAPVAGQTAMQGVGTAAKGAAGLVGQAIAAPENAFMLPYNMAAYEQAKIRANPTAPGLENNPYAQTVRGEFKTQGQAGAANARQAVANQQYGGLNTQEQAILAADRERQRTAARQVLQQPPTTQNFMQRMQALSDLFGGAAQ